MAYTIQRQSTTGLWIIVDTNTGKIISRAELPSDAVNLAVEKGIPRGDLSGLVESAQAQERAENQVASTQTAGDSQGVNQGSDGTGTNAGNSQTAQPISTDEKRNVETAKIATPDSLSTGETEVKGEPPPETSNPQSANNTVVDGQSSQTQSQQTAGSTITPNRLHQYPTYTYGLTLHLLTPDTYNAMARGEEWLPSAKTLISSAGRWGKDEDNKLRFTRPTQFADDFYFDGLTLNTVIGLNSQGRASNVIDISFNLIEPYGLTLLNRLMAVAEELGIPNYLANPYVLQIDFFGNDDVGLPVHPIPDITKYLPIKIIEMKMKVGVGGTTYACRAIPYNHQAFAQTIASTPANFEVKASTVRDFFQNDADESNFSSSLQKNQQRTTEIKNLQNSLSNPAPAQSQAQSRRGSQYQQQQATTKAMIDAKKQAVAKPYEVDSYNSAYNTYQKFLVSSESIQHPTTIKFVIDEEIANAAIVYEKKNSMSATTMNNNKDPKAINKSYAGARSGSSTTGPQLNVERFNINAGTNVMEVINLVMRNSTYITDQLKDDKQTDKNGNPLMMFKVVPQIQLKDFDFVKNDFSYDITFTIKKYNYHNSKHPLMSVSSQEQISRNLRKRYDYIYTGKNSDIIDFSIDFDALFYTAVNVGTKNLGKITESQDTAVEANNTGGAGAGRGSTASYADKLPKQRANVVNPNQVHPVSGDLSASGANAGQNSSIQKAADVMNSVYSSARGDMLNLKLKIIGDPDFIKQDDVFLHPVNTNYPGENETYTESGSILTDRGDIFARVLFKTPVDIDPVTGGLRNEEKYLESNFSGIYKILKVTSEFRGGKFEQSIDAVRFHDDIVDPATSTGVTERTDTTPSTIGGQSELNTAPIQATNASTLRARQDQLSGESTQSYSDVDQLKVENTDTTQVSKLESVAANGETRNITEVQAESSTARDSTADRTAAAPPAPQPDPTPNKEQQIKSLEAQRSQINASITAKENERSAIYQQSSAINKQIKAARDAKDFNLSASLEQQYNKLDYQSTLLNDEIDKLSGQSNDLAGKINQLKGLF